MVAQHNTPARAGPLTQPALVTPTPWEALKNFTDARIALGRAGRSLPTAAHLAFQLAHAEARDAVQLPLDAHGMQADLQGLGRPTMRLHSQATSRAMYLQRPDLGRRLDAASLQALAEWQTRQGAAPGFDVAFVVVDGLSSLAIHQNAVALVALMLQRLQFDTQPWNVAPLTVVEQGRVAIGDEVGTALRANTVVVLIGERPGLSSPDSLGLYLTWAPQVGTTDAARNCISNVRPAGLSLDAAAQTLHRLLAQARQRQLTGVGLKDDVDHALGDAQKVPPHQALISCWQSQSRDSR
ncbi:ethanolamine ammonia-lyase subunit EutC [Rhodoferax sp.]|uniref:ethanolamine ammonia-lyase subunit EutC n=1 Tax=Rhodoferax sp. TaxID=50421 RepID=UPI00260A9890|nr:ethanolamine ammonia-lyase subunit EutC [Rhodoferax sp.]MDD3935456.1 ethanolamine ammonia-lyase subunit EutC [Rhodoferax sp.]